MNANVARGGNGTLQGVRVSGDYKPYVKHCTGTGACNQIDAICVHACVLQGCVSAAALRSKIAPPPSRSPPRSKPPTPQPPAPPETGGAVILCITVRGFFAWVAPDRYIGGWALDG